MENPMNLKNIILYSLILTTQSVLSMQYAQVVEGLNEEHIMLYCRYKTRCCDPVVSCNIALRDSQEQCDPKCAPCCCAIMCCLTMCHRSPKLTQSQIINRIDRHRTLGQLLSCKSAKAPEQQAMPEK